MVIISDIQLPKNSDGILKVSDVSTAAASDLSARTDPTNPSTSKFIQADANNNLGVYLGNGEAGGDLNATEYPAVQIAGYDGTNFSSLQVGRTGRLQTYNTDKNGTAQALLGTAGATAILGDSTITPTADPENRDGWNFVNSTSFQTCFARISSQTTNGCDFRWDNLTTASTNFSYALQRAKLSAFSMQNLTFTSLGVNTQYFFYQTELLFNTLDLSSWVNTSNITKMVYMFRSTNFSGTNTFELNVTGWDTSNVTTMFGWLYECRYLTNIIGLDSLRGDSLTTNGFQVAFYNATRLTFNNNNLHPDFGLNWNITSMDSSFRGIASQSGTSSVPPNTTNWNTSIVSNFANCFQDFEFSTSNYTLFDVSSATTLNGMFYLASGIVNLDMSQSNMSSSNTTMVNFGRNHNTLQTVDFSSCDFSGVTSFSHMFYGSPINSLTFDNTVSFASLNYAVNFLQNNVGGMTTAEYDNFLVRLDTTGLTGAYTLTAGDSTYTIGGAGETARANLVIKGWTITDDGGV